MAVLGPLSVTLEVPDLDAGIRFYTDAGLVSDISGGVASFRCPDQDRPSIVLIAGAPRKRLHNISLRAEDSTASPGPSRSTGAAWCLHPRASRTTAFGSRIRTAC